MPTIELTREQADEAASALFSYVALLEQQMDDDDEQQAHVVSVLKDIITLLEIA